MVKPVLHRCSDNWSYGLVDHDNQYVKIYGEGLAIIEPAEFIPQEYVTDKEYYFDDYEVYTLPNYLIFIRFKPNLKASSVMVYRINSKEFTKVLDIDGSKSYHEIMMILVSNSIDGSTSLGKNIAINFMPVFLKKYTGNTLPYRWQNGKVTYEVVRWSNTDYHILVTSDRFGEQRFDNHYGLQGISVDVDKGNIMTQLNDIEPVKLYHVNNKDGSTALLGEHKDEGEAELEGEPILDATTLSGWIFDTHDYYVFE